MTGPAKIGVSRWPRAAISKALAAATAVEVVGNGSSAWLDLAVRCSLAQAFLAGAAISIMTHAPPAMAGPGALAAGINHLVASPFGVLMQAVCPMLLLFGLLSRLASVPLLVQASLLHQAGSGDALHLFWSVLLGWILVMGPGPISIDALLDRGLDSSAVPGATRLRDLFATVTRHLGRWYRLFVRLWIAIVPLATGAAAFGAPMWSERGAHASWLAAVPHGVAMFPASLSLALGLLLALGLGTRACAILLLLAIPIGQVGLAFDDRLYWTMLLGLLLCHGPGPLALDRLLTARLRGFDLRVSDVRAGLPHVVIVGGGFGGVAAARGLDGAPCAVTLVDERNHHLFQPLLYQVATAGLSPAEIATPIRTLFRAQANVEVRLAAVRGVSLLTSEVVLDRGSLAYDYLVLATGSRHSYFGREDWALDAPGLKNVEDATAIRRRLLLAFERAETATDASERAAFMTFVIVGGGPTGVELAGAIAELARYGLRHEFSNIDPSQARVIVVQSGSRVLPTFPESLAEHAAGALRGLGVEVRTGGHVEDVDASGVLVDGARIEARTVLWAAGVAASPAGEWLGAGTDKAGRVVVGPDLAVAPHRNVFAIGDTAASTGADGRPVPGLASAAKQAGSYVAALIRSRLDGRPDPHPFRYRHAGSLATIGRRTAVADFGGVRLHGALAWWVWGAVHILFLAGGRNRTAVLVQWGWAYLTGRRGSRLITERSMTP